MTKKVKKGDKVKLHYTGRLEDGKVFDSSKDRDPIQFEAGAGEIIPGLDEAIIGMEAGEKKDISISSDNAYGNYEEKLLIDIPNDKLPKDIKPEKDKLLNLVDKQGRTIPAKVMEIKDNSIVVDANHPLAGQDLDFEIELVEIV